MSLVSSNKFSPLVLSYWEKSCLEISKRPHIRYIDEIKGPEYWDFDGLCIRSEKEPPVIIALNRNLSLEEAELTILHEITHEVLMSRGFWEVRCLPNLELIAPIVSCYSSVLTDPLIDQILKREGFRVDLLLQRDFNKISTWFNDSTWEIPRNDDPVFEMEVLRLIRLYFSRETEIWKKLEVLYRWKAKEIWGKALDSIEMIEQIGFDSPEKQFICLEKLIALSTIRPFLALHSISQPSGSFGSKTNLEAYQGG